jgi:NitT/TauT family transport system substrate-binding protein
MRRSFVRACGLLVLLASAGCSRHGANPSGAPSPAAPEKVRFQTDWFPQAEHGGFYQALAKGIYRRAGLDVEILNGRPGFTAPQSVMSGVSDLAMARSDDIITMVSRGLPLVIVGAFMQHDPQGILVHAEDSIRTFPDLNGRTLMAGPGVNWTDYLKRKFQIDFHLIPVNFGIAQFMADPHFAQQCFVTSEPYYVEQHGGHPRVLLISDSGYDPYRVMFTSREFLRDHPGAVRAFVAASLRGWDDFMNGDPSPAIALITQRNVQMPVGLIRYSIQALGDNHCIAGWADRGERLGRMTPQRMQEQSDILAEMKIIAQPVPVRDFTDFDFVPPAPPAR